MATKKKASKTKKAPTKPPRGKGILQTDDPIIVKPGSSLYIEIDKRFSDAHTPSKPNKKGHKHPRATRLRSVVILDQNLNVKRRINITNATDRVAICYDTPDGCDCP